jgi:membrane fusion protein (multidrug efflux system)
VVPVLQQDVPLTHEWVGTLDGAVNAEIRPQVEGYVLRQVYKEGAAVRKGAPLFEIDPRQFKAAYDQAQAALARDAAARDKAKQDVERFTPLAAQRAVSQQELDNARSALQQAQASVDASQATFDRAKLNLEWTRVVSPIDGVAGIAKVQVGDLVNGLRVMTTVSTVDPIKVYFSASEQEFMSWARDWSGKGGAKGSLELTLSDGRVYARRGDPLLADRNVDLKTGTITLAGLFPNPEHLLRPGQYAKVRASVGVSRGALLVPQRAVWEIQGNPQVALVGGDNKVEIRPIQTGARVGTLVVVEKGLQAGNRIVVEGIQKVSSGQLVIPAPSTPATGK